MKAYNCNDIIEKQLIDRAEKLEEQVDGDVLFFCGPISFGIDDLIKDVIESRTNKRNKLCVLLETLGGHIDITERIVQTIRSHYSLVDFIIPNYAYSAGTVLALSGDDIYMNYYSRLGPIDPQLQRDDKMIPALGYLVQYERLIKKSDKGKLTTAELAYLINKFDPAELYMYEQARQLSITLLKDWLVKYKFKNWTITKTRGKKVTAKMKNDRAKDIARQLNKTDYWHTHVRGISIDLLRKNLKLKINDFGEDPDLNDKIQKYYSLLKDYMLRRSQQAIIHTCHRYIDIQ